MKKCIFIFFMFISIIVLSQNDSIYNSFGKIPLNDCQVYSKSPNAIKCEDTSWLKYSYEFDNKGRIIKKMKHQYSISENSYLVTYTYDNNDRLINTTNYSKFPNNSYYKNKLDTTTTDYFYNEKGKLIKKIIYSIENNQKIENWGKMEYIYTPFDSIEKFIIYEYWPKKGYDTVYIESYSYNSKKLKSEVEERDIAGHYSANYGEGITKFRYNEQEKLEEINHIAKREKPYFVYVPENNYSSLYRYSYNSDSVVFETLIQYSYLLMKKTVRDEKNRLVKKYKGYVSYYSGFSSAIKNNVPDIESEFDEIRNEIIFYDYDSFDRIKSIRNYDNLEYRNSKLKWTNGHNSTEFIYRRDGYFNIPEEEFDNDNY